LPGVPGRPRPELRPDLRSFPFRRYVIFFRYGEDELVVLNILSARRDIDGAIDGDDE
jgi:plasmid stabilization system protein ParE